MSKSPTQTVAAKIRAEAAQQRISQIRIAEALGMSQQSVSKRMSGRVPFRIDELYIVADVLGTTPDTLLQGVGVTA